MSPGYVVGLVLAVLICGGVVVYRLRWPGIFGYWSRARNTWHRSFRVGALVAVIAAVIVVIEAAFGWLPK